MPQITVGDHVLSLVVATAESLSGYGWIMGQPAGIERDKIDFYGKEVRLTNPAEFKSNDDTTLNLVSFTQRPYEVRWMEYHTKHTKLLSRLPVNPSIWCLARPHSAGQTVARTRARSRNPISTT